MSALFISDLHLDPSRPEATDTFIRFLRADARDARRLFILGDLFEAWIGDDDPNPHHAMVQDALRDYTDSNPNCFFVAGNRDFLIGKKFAERTGVTLLPDPTLIEVAGTSLVIMHGDTLCTDDTDYQRARRILRHPLTLKIFDHLPLSMRENLARKAREKSKQHTQSTQAKIMDVNQAAVEDCLRSFGVDTLLHGHTHRPAEHTFKLDDRTGTRIVLSDWYSSGHVLSWDETGRHTTTMPFS